MKTTKHVTQKEWDDSRRLIQGLYDLMKEANMLPSLSELHENLGFKYWKGERVWQYPSFTKETLAFLHAIRRRCAIGKIPSRTRTWYGGIQGDQSRLAIHGRIDVLRFLVEHKYVNRDLSHIIGQLHLERRTIKS